MKRFNVMSVTDNDGKPPYLHKSYDDDGLYVLYTDVQSLQAERNRLREALERVARVIPIKGENPRELAIHFQDIARKALEGGTHGN